LKITREFIVTLNPHSFFTPGFQGEPTIYKIMNIAAASGQGIRSQNKLFNEIKIQRINSKKYLRLI